MKKLCFLILSIAVVASANLFAKASEISQTSEITLGIGFVNFKVCVEKSKQGQQERYAFEALKKQMSDSLEKTNKELVDLENKLQNQDYMDGLSPTAEMELKEKFQVLSQEFVRYQNQYYQLLNQANYSMLQTLHQYVSEAAETVREQRHLNFVLSEESAFAACAGLNLTDEVVKEMDKRFERENGQTASIENAIKG